jgi:sulfur carrier protein ThiS
VLGGDVQKIDFEDGMTVGQALQNAGVERQDGAVVQVNGQPASDDDVLETGSVVQVTSRIKNG